MIKIALKELKINPSPSGIYGTILISLHNSGYINFNSEAEISINDLPEDIRGRLGVILEDIDLFVKTGKRIIEEW